MHQYLQDTRFAVEGLIALITQDAVEYTLLREQHEKAAAKDAYYHTAFQLREMGPDANYWYAMRYEAGTALNGLAAELRELEDRIVDKRQSLAALSGAVLQIAKQGISSVRKRPDNTPNTREVFGVDIKWLIWAARNQSIHYENPQEINDETQKVFDQLNAARPPEAPLDPRSQINWAHEIIQALGWESYLQYEVDMSSLLG